MAENAKQIVHGISLAIGKKINILEGVRDTWQNRLDSMDDASSEAFCSEKYMDIEDNIHHIEEAISQLEDAQFELNMIF